MTLKIIGRKKGMTRLFDDKGDVVVCTVIAVEPNVVTQIKRKDKEGYEALQLSGILAKGSRRKNVTKPLVGHYAKAGVEPRLYVKQSKVENAESYALGQEIGVNYFADNTFVDVTGISKGKGHQGVIKRHGFAGGPAAHGSGFHRHGGSCGMRTSPGRCLPGQKKSGRMGGEQVTIQSLRVLKIDEEKQVILVQGAIPGANNGLVYLMKPKKKAK